VTKIGRNEPCPCNSGKKYKRCHGSGYMPPTPTDFRAIHQQMEAARVQRERQQGLGSPIISSTLGKFRFVAVKNRLMYSERWKTFHDFLSDYLKDAIGRDWGNSEIAKPAEKRHPIVLWYQELCRYQATFIKSPGEVHSAPMTGTAAAYMNLAYDLYAIDHNAELQKKVLSRLRNPDKFSGARYELFVAAKFVRAGFEIEFENEDDRAATHCEFTATHRVTKNQFSVEAKRREGRRLRIGHLFNQALLKDAKHQRIVFIDCNVRQEPPGFLSNTLRRIRSFEGQPLAERDRPSAYVFLTNTPWDLYGDLQSPPWSIVALGFQMPSFLPAGAISLRTAIEARQTHIEMHDLMQSMRDHSEIPSTFDGEMPVFAFGDKSRRLKIGERYLVKDQNGMECPAVLTAATVDEQSMEAICGMSFEDGRSRIYKMPLSTDELTDWHRHRDTFFGVVGPRISKADTPLQMYDFIYEASKGLSRDQLLTALRHRPDYGEIMTKDHNYVLSAYAEEMTNAAWPVPTVHRRE
jgi:hypothetical protein